MSAHHSPLGLGAESEYPAAAQAYARNLWRLVRRALANGAWHVTNAAALLAELRADGSLGQVTVRLSFDHRIFDGALAARVLTRLDRVLNSSILDELRELAVGQSHSVKGGLCER